MRDEHIIPFSLGGNAEIKEANCVACQNAINPADTYIAQEIFGNYRIQAGTQTRRPKNRPTVLPARFTLESGDVEMDLPIQDHPYTLALPIWGAPGFFRGANIDAPFPEHMLHVYHYIPPNLHETLGLSEGQPYRVWSTHKINLELFIRAIAKIAYCHAVLYYGLDGFRPLALTDIILGRFSGLAYFVGTPLTDPPPPLIKGGRHQITFAELNSLPSHPMAFTGCLNLIVARVRLFGDSSHKEHGLPIYDVITGVRGKQRIDKRRPLLTLPKTILLG